MKFLNITDDLIRQILRLNEQERRKPVQIINARSEQFDEGHIFFEQDFPEETITIIRLRTEDIEEEHPCLIEFDDYL